MKFLAVEAFAAALLIFSPLMGASLAIYPGEQFISAGQASYYQASNSAEYPIAVVIETTDWNITEEGTEDNQPTDEIVVFPCRFILNGKSMRKIRVSYRDKKPPAQEKTYRVIIREVPVSFNKEEPLSGIYMAIAYRTACYVKPIKSVPKLTLVEAIFSGDLLQLTVANRGNAHLHIKDPLLQIKDGAGREQIIDDKAVGRVLTNKNLHAGRRRRFTLNLSDLGLAEGKTMILQCGEEGERQKLTQLLKKGEVVQAPPIEAVARVAELDSQEEAPPCFPEPTPVEELKSSTEETPLDPDGTCSGVEVAETATESESFQFEALSLSPTALFQDKWWIYIEPAAPIVSEDDHPYPIDADSAIR